MTFAVPLRYEFPCIRIDGTRIAAANVNAKSHVGEAFNESIIRLDGTLKISLGIFAARAHSLKGNLIDIGRVARSVDLNIAAARLNQRRNHPTFDGDNIGDEIV